jgi:membrane-bound lytic murein transglycosylase B
MSKKPGAIGWVVLAPWFLACLWAGNGLASEDRFGQWLQGLKAEALSQGISASTLEKALGGISPIPRVIELDRSQPEVKWTLQEYLARVVTEARISSGRQQLALHRELLDQAERDYGVPAQVLTALWGMETDYGRLPGKFPVIASVATLAYDGRRGSYFRKELLLALRILDQGHITPEEMTGSWAGAMGHFQFMPSTFVEYALDADGDGRKDIWNNLPDAVASAANYLASMGWKRGLPWGSEVRLPKKFDSSLIGQDARRPVSAWRSLGIRGRDEGPLNLSWDGEAWLVAPQWPGGRAFLVNRNYRALYRWNPSHSFAIAVGILSDKIGGNSSAP